MRIVKVKFLSSRDDEGRYYYKDLLSKKLKKYDTVIVPTRYGISIATVMETDIEIEDIPFTFNALKKVNEKIKSKTVDSIVNKEKIKDIKAELDRKIKQIDSIKKYEVYANLDPSVALLIKELEELYER